MTEKSTESKTCNVPACERKHFGLGYCNAHYQQFKKGIEFTPVRANRRNGELAKRDELGRKFCLECEEWKFESEFSKHGGTVDKLQSYCKKCYRRRDVARQYGVDPLFFEESVTKLGGVCPICSRSSERWAIDHDHNCCGGIKSCGKCIRGVICQSCNMGLGSFGDSINALESAIRYLKGELNA